MKAACIHAFGGPEVVNLEDVPKPQPGSAEILVRVHAAGVNPVDWKIREGHLGKFPLPQILGIDFSGVVESLGPDVKDFRVGDAVFGTVADESGSFAEYAVSSVSQVAKKPASLDHVQAASLPVASMTAWQALFDAAELMAGQKVLIHAAAGGVGGFAVQFAKWKGAHVIGTASTRNLDFVRQLGADEVIDYRTTKFEEVVRDIDVVLDTVGGDTQKRSWGVLKPGGILVSIVQPPSNENASGRGVRGVFLRSNHNRGDQLARIADLVVSGVVKTYVETVLPLKEVRKALDLSQSGRTRGKIVLMVGSNGD
ncbi:MAG: Alcohol dehydrogenase zinc-binding domain protein [Pedosphaera sp.]|nr:Alcohol dehydrogenase zinc-binding domain protein [Pedosphaera sp.]